MPEFSNSFIIARPIAAVFDAATTVRYWPQWHPATLAVAGDVEYPARLGDTITERVNFGGMTGEGTWTVVAWQPPTGLTLEARTSLGLTRIEYALAETADGTLFHRDLSYELGPPALDALMAEQSAVALARLKALLETLIPAGDAADAPD